MKRHLNSNEIYVVYQFPNLKRSWQPDAESKVGVRLKYDANGNPVNVFRKGVSDYYKHAKYRCCYWVPNFGDFKVLEDNFVGTLKDALSREFYWQDLHNSVDNAKSQTTKDKSLDIRKRGGKKGGKNGGKNSANLIHTCEHCTTVGKGPSFFKKHGDRCESNPNGPRYTGQ